MAAKYAYEYFLKLVILFKSSTKNFAMTPLHFLFNLRALNLLSPLSYYLYSFKHYCQNDLWPYFEDPTTQYGLWLVLNRLATNRDLSSSKARLRMGSTDDIVDVRPFRSVQRELRGGASKPTRGTWSRTWTWPLPTPNTATTHASVPATTSTRRRSSAPWRCATRCSSSWSGLVCQLPRQKVLDFTIISLQRKFVPSYHQWKHTTCSLFSVIIRNYRVSSWFYSLVAGIEKLF